MTAITEEERKEEVEDSSFGDFKEFDEEISLKMQNDVCTKTDDLLDLLEVNMF